MKTFICLFTFLLFGWTGLLLASCETSGLSTSAGITVDLRNPEYSAGVLSTTQGGVITAPNMRMQAECIAYTHGSGTPGSVVAEGNVRVEYRDRQLIGRRIVYNFAERTGFLYEGRTALYPWFFGGRLIQLCEEGSYIVYDGFVTTSERDPPQWSIQVGKAALFPNHDLTAEGVTFRLGHMPVFWLHSLRTNLDTLSKHPIKYTLRWGGRQGSRIGMSYEFLNWGPFKGLFRLDYNFKRGPGGGIEFHYRHRERAESFDGINYFAKDNSLTYPHQHTRYRFQGHYTRSWREGKTLFDMTYDKLSDQDMATDYSDRGIELDVALRSQMLINYREEAWIGTMAIRPRLNGFQTTKQELPTLSVAFRPLSFLPAIVGFNAEASYLDFVYAHGLSNGRDFTATRCALQPYVYIPLHLGPVHIAPRADLVAIFYGNTPIHHSSTLATTVLRVDAQTRLSRPYPAFFHTVLPYASYVYIPLPSLSPRRHYIFDIEDGWYYTHALKLGVQQQLIERPFLPIFSLDTYVWSFLTNGLGKGDPIPYAAADLSFFCYERLKNTLGVSWDLAHSELMMMNFKSSWTLSERAAFSLEYRQRSAYEWRKVDRENFALDFFHTEKALLHSPLSDRRRTLLLHFYWNVTYDCSIEWESRLGWNRCHERHYFEFDCNLHKVFAGCWKMKLAYQHKEYDDRIAVYFSLSTGP